jgi:SAM-dependent methyltransferase
MTSNVDPLGSAIKDFLSHTSNSSIEVESNLTEHEEIPVHYLFRKKEQMPEKEIFALSKTQGRILDVGAGSGAHALVLQQEGKDVVALDISVKCCEAMREQGVSNIACEDFFTFDDKEKFDTILLLMNGFGIAGSLDNLESFIQKCKSLLKPGGIIIGESADILYLFEEEDGSVNIDLNGSYHGDMQYRMTYKNEVGNWFPWLYVSADLITDISEKIGFQMIDFYEGDEDDFVICLKLQ